MNNNYPQPDPTWIYYPVWQQVTAAHAALEELIKYMSTEECEQGSRVADESIDQTLSKAHIAIIEAEDILRPRTDPEPKASQN
ncbi:MAG: hypothetical protein RMY28_009300 [Nostoc sp. ChiSLP01]|nr:hypothetical protein [Nostoc sp. CmiSLP01]MDZ8285247.1 hypothetical protein [Nostoc sp. ChiSLP01]